MEKEENWHVKGRENKATSAKAITTRNSAETNFVNRKIKHN
jgi:hypothetical protein